MQYRTKSTIFETEYYYLGYELATYGPGPARGPLATFLYCPSHDLGISQYERNKQFLLLRNQWWKYLSISANNPKINISLKWSK